MLSLAAGLLLGANQVAFADVTFTVSDTPGHWFDAGSTWDLAGSRSLAVINPGDAVYFTQTVGPKAMESYHTITNLVWPTLANGPVGPMGIQDRRIKTITTSRSLRRVYTSGCASSIPICSVAVIVDEANTHSTLRQIQTMSSRGHRLISAAA